MRTGRRLTLRKEALTDLTTDEMAGLAGGQQPTVPCPYSALQCLTRVTRCQVDLSAVLADCPL